MPKSAGQKLKLLYIIRMLEEYSDEVHPLSTAQIIERLEAEGIHSERKSIYDDMEKLSEFGYDIIQVHSRQGGGYYLGSRDFELPELKLLVDAVQSSRFITTKKSRELIKKLEKLAGKHDAGKLQRQVYVAGRVKTENEGIYYSIDTIHNAIQENRKITFSYMDWNLKKELVVREHGDKKVSPWALIWRDENYYLAAFDGTDSIMKHYRVDKMGSVKVSEEKREGLDTFEKLDLAAYTNRTFGMYGGDEEMITLRFSNKLIGVVMDRFGKEADIRPDGEDAFLVRAKVAVSGQFFGWLTGIGKEAKLIKPERVKEEYRSWLQGILKE